MSQFAFSLMYPHGLVMRETDCPSSQIIKSYMLFEIKCFLFFFLNPGTLQSGTGEEAGKLVGGYGAVNLIRK